MVMSLRDLFGRHCLASYDQQLCLAAVVGDKPWQLDLDRGLLSFSADLAFPIQVLGAQAEHDRSWLWAWANRQSGIPPALLRSALQLRDFGIVNGVKELTEPRLIPREIDGHYFALVAAGVCKADCYYRCPYEGGAAFALIPEAPQVRAQADRSATWLASRILEVISKWEVDHRSAIEAYLEFKGYRCRKEAEHWLAEADAENQLVLEFDELGRLSKLETSREPPPRRDKDRAQVGLLKANSNRVARSAASLLRTRWKRTDAAAPLASTLWRTIRKRQADADDAGL